MPRSLQHHRAHDYPHLIRRWRSVASKAGLRMDTYARAGDYDLHVLESRRSRTDAPSVYFSAGIHGDEPAATEGLLEWTATHTDLLREVNALIFPCLNPWALVNNTRRDAEGRDLNRSYHLDDVPQISAQMRLIVGRRFDLALALHEDYDALGLYIYEVPGVKPHWGEKLVQAARRHVPPDPRRKIEGRAAQGGIVRRAISLELMPEWPEAFVLHFHKVPRVFTVETPSEFHLDDRVAAHVAVLSKAMSLCRGER